MLGFPNTMKKKIAYLTWGSSSEITSFHDFTGYLDDLIYVRDLPSHDLGECAAIVVPDGMNPAEIRACGPQLNDYVRGGGFLVVFAASVAPDWLDVVDVRWRKQDSADWLWWTKPERYIEIREPDPRHALNDVIPLADMGWHWFGVLDFHPDATSALNLDDDSASLLLDYADLPAGRVLISTLDPHGHNGERFMPATTRFLKGFYPWLNREVGIDRAKKTYTVTYLQCIDDVIDPGMRETLAESLRESGGTVRDRQLYDLGPDDLSGTDILFVPHLQDQFHLRTLQPLLLDYLRRGGHLIACSEPALPWLPFLGAFEAVPPRPFTNIRCRVKDDPFDFFANMDDDFDGWCGVFGQYARGWSRPPQGAITLVEVGSAEDPKPADWLWQYPTDDGRGGFVMFHNGDTMIRYPDHGPHKEALVRDICIGLIQNSGTTVNRF